MSIVRPTPAQKTRRLAVLAAAVFAIVVPVLQNFMDLGLTQAEFAADGNQTLRVAGYAFSIWGLIYVGIALYAIRQVLPNTGESTLINRMGWPSFVAFFGIGLWIIMAAMNLKVASVAVIFASLLALIIPLLALSGAIRSTSMAHRDRMLLIWPLSALAGWLTIAAPLNLITTATALNALPASLSPMGWALVAVGAVTVVGLGISWALRTITYPLPIAWGLIGVFVAEQELKPTLAFSALGAAFVLVVCGVIFAFSLRRGVERVA